MLIGMIDIVIKREESSLNSWNFYPNGGDRG